MKVESILDKALKNIPEEAYNFIRSMKIKDLAKMICTDLMPKHTKLILVGFELKFADLKNQVEFEFKNKRKLKIIKKEIERVQKVLRIPVVRGVVIPALEMEYEEFIEKAKRSFEFIQDFDLDDENLVTRMDNWYSKVIQCELKQPILSDEKKLELFNDLDEVMSKLMPQNFIPDSLGKINLSNSAGEELMKKMWLPVLYFSFQKSYYYSLVDYYNQLKSGTDVSQKNENGISDEKKIEIVKSHLAPLRGKNEQGEQILFESDYKLLEIYMLDLVLKNELPENVKPMRPHKVTCKTLNRMFYAIHKEVVPGRIININFVRLLKDVFPQFTGDLEVMKKKFSQ